MFSKIWTMKSTENYSDNIKRLKQAIHNADAILIGAGAGLSASAGYTYDSVRFRNILLISTRNTGFLICIPAVSIHTKRWKNTGRGGQGIFTVTVTTNRKTKCTKCC